MTDFDAMAADLLARLTRLENGLRSVGEAPLLEPQVTDGPADAKAERVFLDLLAAFTAQGRVVSDSPSRNYAPSEFASQGADAIGKEELKGAMKRLLLAGRIRVETYGSPTRRRKRLVIEPPKDRDPQSTNAVSNALLIFRDEKIEEIRKWTRRREAAGGRGDIRRRAAESQAH